MTLYHTKLSFLAFSYTLIVTLTLMACSDKKMPVEAPEDPVRTLQPAFDGETGISIRVNGNPINDSNLADKLIVQVGIDSPTFDGDPDSKNITKSPSHTAANAILTCQSCETNVRYHDLLGADPGTLEQHEGTLADGDYTITLKRDDINTTIDEIAIAVNHTDGGTGDNNGTFLNEASDQIVTFYLDDSLNSVQSPDVDDPHTRASTHLSASIIQPTGPDTTIGVGNSLTVEGSASDGVGGTKKYAWDWNASGSNQETFDTEFSTSTTASHTYNNTGDYTIRLIARDGNDDPSSGTHGGHYAMSTTKTVHVAPAKDADAAGHTLPDTVEVYDVVATSVTMKNTGADTWSGSSYKLAQASSSQVWSPLTVDLDTATVDMSESHTFNFNIRTVEPEELGYQDNFWRMSYSGNLFGEQNGHLTYVEEGSPGSGWSEWIQSLAGWLSPASAFAHLPSWISDLQEEIVQEMRIEDLPVPTRLLEDKGEFRLRYLASLNEPWNVDFRFHIVFDHSALKIGPIIQGLRSSNHRLKVEMIRPGEVVIKGTREGVTGLNGHGVVLEIPIVLRPDADAPSTLPLVELIATR